MSLLIAEPPLLVLPSLAREVGLPAGILLQQLHYAGGKTPDGWVTRSAPDWSKALRKVLAPRTIERAFAKLKEEGWVEATSSPGMPTSYRVAPDKVAGVTSAAAAGEGPPLRRGSVSRERTAEKETRKSPSSEMPEFGEWIGFHATHTSSKVPAAGTKGRAHIASMYAARRSEGISHDDLKLAVVGAYADDFRRERGYFDPESVLRPTKVHKLIEAGRRAQPAEGRTDYGAFDD